MFFLVTNFNYKEKKKRKLLISPCSILCILYSTRCCTIIKIYIFLSSQDTKIISLVLNIWIWYWIYIHTCNPTYNYLPKYWWFIYPTMWYEMKMMIRVCHYYIVYIYMRRTNKYLYILKLCLIRVIFFSDLFLLVKPCLFI